MTPKIPVPLPPKPPPQLPEPWETAKIHVRPSRRSLRSRRSRHEATALRLAVLAAFLGDRCLVLPAEFQIVSKARKPAAQSNSPDAGSYRVIVLRDVARDSDRVPDGLGVRAPLSRPARICHVSARRRHIARRRLLRRHCFRQLGASFTGDVRATPDQRIVTTGAYAVVRHPSYSAGILMNVGWVWR